MTLTSTTRTDRHFAQGSMVDCSWPQSAQTQSDVLAAGSVFVVTEVSSLS
jgi:hypothetical protein